MYKKLLLRLSAIVLCCIFTGTALAQNRTISGTVTDAADGSPLPGVSVVVTGMSVGTTSNAKGVYTLSVPASAKTISFSYIGYTSKQMPLTADATLNVALSAANNSLQEVVVVSVGYGTLDKREVSSAITHVSSKDLLPVASNSPLMSLQGKVAGLSITNTSGADPNSSPSVQLRGVSSRNAGLGPLYVVNGVPGGNIDNINQNDIESIDVLKGGAASAIYGTRGSNGVIIITTKKGSSQARTFYEGYASFDYLTNQLQNLTP